MALDRNESLENLYKLLQRMLGLHRQLLESVRAEKEALIAADHKKLSETNIQKESQIEQIRLAELDRMRLMGGLSIISKKPIQELHLSNLVIWVQGFDLKAADQLRSVYQALQILVKRITEQNEYNKGLVLNSLKNVEQMKKNVLGEATGRSSTYDARGKRNAGAGGEARLIAQKA